MRKTMIAALLAAAAFGVTACGGGGSDSKTLSKSDLVAKANSICDKAQTDAKAVKAPDNIQDASAAAAYFDKIAPITQKETDDLKALKPADDVKDDWNALITAQTNANDLLQTIKDKADKKDASGLKDLNKIGDIGDKVTAAAKKVGANTCG